MNCTETIRDIVSIWFYEDGFIQFSDPFNTPKEAYTVAELGVSKLSELLNKCHFSSCGDRYGAGVIDFSENSAEIAVSTSSKSGLVSYTVKLTIPLYMDSALTNSDRLLFSRRCDFIIEYADGRYGLIRSTSGGYSFGKSISIGSKKKSNQLVFTIKNLNGLQDILLT